MQSSTWHYAHSCQWRYEAEFTEYGLTAPNPRWAKGHAIDLEAKAVRAGWMPFTPHFHRNPIDVVAEAERPARRPRKTLRLTSSDQVASKKLNFAIEDPDAAENWPRVWFIWRGNAMQSSAKGHEFFLRHYLGTHDNVDRRRSCRRARRRR